MRVAAAVLGGLHLGFLVAVPLTLSFLHFLLYLFDRRSAQNLYLAILAASFAGVALTDFNVIAGEAQWILIPSMVLSIAAFVYSTFLPRQPIQLTVFAVVALLVAVIGLIDERWGHLPGRLFVLAVIFDTFRVTVQYWDRRPSTSLLPAAGMIAFGLGGAADILADLGVIEPLFGIRSAYLYGGSLMLLAMSIHLARSYAATNRDLERQLVRVQDLMNQTVAQEEAAREAEVRRRVIEADHERKTRELIEARELQLSMIPQEVPQTPGWEIAASMEVATEVGGDYYDVRVDGSGGFTIAIGDAVGHGMRAGIIVAATKALFTSARLDEPIAETLRRFDDALRSMRLTRAHMCLLLARWCDGGVEIVNAGMPPPVIRAADGSVRELDATGPPLGIRNPAARESRMVSLADRDLLLLTSDGVPEAKRPSGDAMFGYDALHQAPARERRLVAVATHGADRIRHRSSSGRRSAG